MITAIIVDDETYCREALKQTLTECAYKVSVVAEYDSADTAHKQLAATPPDLVFLDVEMPGKTGLELLSELNSIHFSVIFTTAYEKYALQAIKASALDYLLKPVQVDDLNRSLKRFREREKAHDVKHQVEIMMQHYLHKGRNPGQIAVPNLNGFDFIDTAEIVRLQARDNYTNVFLASKKTMIVSRTLKEFEEILPAHLFFRIHHSHIINLQCIKKYIKGKDAAVVMKDGTELTVSRNRKEAFLQQFEGIRL